MADNRTVAAAALAIAVLLFLLILLTPPLYERDFVRVYFDPASFRGITKAAVDTGLALEDLPQKLEQIGYGTSAQVAAIYQDIPLQEVRGSRLCEILVLDGRCKGDVVAADLLWLKRY